VGNKTTKEVLRLPFVPAQNDKDKKRGRRAPPSRLTQILVLRLWAQVEAAIELIANKMECLPEKIRMRGWWWLRRIHHHIDRWLAWICGRVPWQDIEITVNKPLPNLTMIPQ